MNKFRTVLAGLGCALILAAAGLAAKNITEGSRAEKLSAQAAEQLEALILSQPEIDEPLTSQVLAPEPAGESMTSDAADSPAARMPTVKIYSREYIGMLSIPSLELELPVISQWSDENLKAAPCRYYGSLYTDDLVIAGHNFHAHFGRLKKLALGDELRFTDALGTEYSFKISAIETLQPEDVDKMCSGESALTLFTCTADGSERLTLRCSLI